VSALAIDEASGIALAVTPATDRRQAADFSGITQSSDGRFTIAVAGGYGPFTQLRHTLRRVDEHDHMQLFAHAVVTLGVAETLRLVEGPLAIAVWDRSEQLITIGRDRFGQEPLFAAWAGTSFLFATHLFSLLVHPEFRRDIDRGAVAQYLRFSTSHSPATMLSGAVRIHPGAIVTIRGDRHGSTIPQQPVISIRNDAIRGLNHRFTGSFAEATDALEQALQTSLREATADPAAPLGIFFSGGVDSTLVATVASTMRERQLTAITAGFAEAEYDESAHARGIATHLGLTQEIVTFGVDDFRDLLPEVTTHFQEPFGDLAALPAIKLARAAAKSAPLVMTGDGGDEFFMGSPSDFMLWNVRGRLRGPLRPLAATGADLLAVAANRSRGLVDRYVPERYARVLRPTRIKKAAVGLHARTAEEGVAAIFCDTLNPREFVLHVEQEPLTHYHNRATWLPTDDQDDRWRFAVVQGYTQEREVPKHQHSTAAAGIGYRSIFLHPAVVELAWSLPPVMRDHGGVSRALVRAVIERTVPPEVYRRGKAGFNVPFDRWLRGPLRDIGEELLDPARLAREGIFEPRTVKREWDQHQSGKYDRRFILYDLISFQLWVESMQRVPVAR
jgi:asparagine synthase (glutamine-hydrolysing)